MTWIKNVLKDARINFSSIERTGFTPTKMTKYLLAGTAL
jgi:hypothetical protein